MKANEPPPVDVARYLAKLGAKERAALERLRAQILAAAPRATEKISYGMPMYFLDGSLVSFGAFAKHLTFFVQSSGAIEAQKDALDGRTYTKAGIHFTPEKPLSGTLVKKLVKARIAENRAIVAERDARRAAKKAATAKKR